MSEIKTENILGNANLASKEEERAAKLLKEKNLEHTNRISEEVHPKNTFYSRVVKRALDILISLPACVILLPLNAVFAVCTFFDVGAPILYKQTRMGKGGKRFTMIKFRSMNNKTDTDGKLLPPSERVTGFGKIMRKLSLDELLSFGSVLKGDMSIIGPRPAPVFIYERMSDRHKQRTAVRPGLECPRLIQVKDGETYKYQRTYENDIWYVENVSFALDVKMLLHLFKMVFSLKKRGNQANGSVTYFVGYDEAGRALSLKNFLDIQEEKPEAGE